MRPDFKLPDQHKFVMSPKLPPNYKGLVLPGSQVITATDPAAGQIIHQELKQPHFTIRFITAQLLQPLKIYGYQAATRLASFLSVRNTVQVQVEGLANQQVKQGQFTLLHTPGKPVVTTFNKAKPYACMEIAWSDEWLESVAKQFDFLQQVFAPAKKKKTFFLPPKPRPAGYDALGMANTILTSPYTPEMNHLFLKCHAYEYMMLLLMEASKKEGKHLHLTETQREQLRALGEEVLNGFDKKFHIPELSKKTGMNTMKLKNGFKEVNGEPMSRIHMRGRMLEARRLLADTDVPIKQIANRVGYALTQSFLPHFKKYFGYAASDLRRKG